MATTKVNINGINELDFPSGVSSASVANGVATVNLSGGGSSAMFSYINGSPDLLANWTWVNQGSASAVQSKGSAILMTVPFNASLNWRYLVKSLPASPCKVMTWVRTNAPQANSNAFGICLRNSSTGKIMNIELLTQAGVNTLRVEKLTNATTDTSTAASIAFGTTLSNQSFNPTFIVALQVRYDGTSIYFDYSHDGENFLNLFSETAATFLGTPDQYGFGGVEISSGTAYISLMAIRNDANATL